MLARLARQTTRTVEKPLHNLLLNIQKQKRKLEIRLYETFVVGVVVKCTTYMTDVKTRALHSHLVHKSGILPCTTVRFSTYSCCSPSHLILSHPSGTAAGRTSGSGTGKFYSSSCVFLLASKSHRTRFRWLVLFFDQTPGQTSHIQCVNTEAWRITGVFSSYWRP